jgi:hypothetical protein
VNAYSQHHEMEASERFGDGVDFDKDGVADERTRSDITAATLFQAVMEIPGPVIRHHPVLQEAIRQGEIPFRQIGCASCHVPALTLSNPVYSEPNPYNPAGNLRPQDWSGQMLPPGCPALVTDETGHPRSSPFDYVKAMSRQ